MCPFQEGFYTLQSRQSITDFRRGEQTWGWGGVSRKACVDRETEIEAYKVTLQEARRIGLNDDTILNYLSVSWITPEEHKRLARRLDVN